MITETVEAIYENGVLPPLRPLRGLVEHSRVTVVVESVKDKLHPLSECIGTLPDDYASELREIIENEFEKVSLRDWQ